MATRGRGRLSKIDLLPEECDDVVAWAAQEMADRDRPLTEIYPEFCDKLIAVQGEYGVGFDIPSFSSFHRHSVKLAQMTRRLQQTREMAAIISERMDAEASDDLTLIAAEAIKTLIFELLQSSGESGLSTKGAQELANALRAATAAQSVSTTRRQKVEAAFEAKTEEVIEKVSQEAGLSSETIAQLRRDFLGVRPKEGRAS
ncbi:DUF3486 family protein [Martelella mediterranea]|uniref:Uncharacterized protein DUF3486 n=1 Tax=Martelella mediterranea TaxID=293089 RepID=A0A4R3P2K1_9HYPH|nr:DUF3486 family protein [Martelella mediterranea]TCT41163.1 uncharacterized protein DUF3486 [Martelella mediterranea]